MREIHGVAILYDCHSIRSRIPYLFDGVLPDFNIGTNGGTTCDPSIEAAVKGRGEPLVTHSARREPGDQTASASPTRQ